jgi:predicted N-acetyltransferase YhbS
MNLAIRPVRAEDVEACGRAAFNAHQQVAATHGFDPELPSLEFATGVINGRVSDPNAWGVVAERDGQIIGSVFLNLFPPAPVAAIGPLTVAPSGQGGTGERLMEAALDEAQRRGIERVRLVQSPSHRRSLALYVKVGFEVREPLLIMQGKPPPPDPAAEAVVRAATLDDLTACNEICTRAHGFARELELSIAIARDNAAVVEADGRITGYAAGIGFLGHAVAESDDHLWALIAHAPVFLGQGFFVPARNTDLLRRLLQAGVRIGWPATLMTIGPYLEPELAYLPSIAFWRPRKAQSRMGALSYGQARRGSVRSIARFPSSTRQLSFRDEP